MTAFCQKPIKRIQKKFIGMLLAAVCLVQVVGGLTTIAAAPVIGATDTVAGFGSQLATSIAQARQKVNFRVTKPDGAVIEIQTTADERGIARTDFVGFHTKRIGNYSVRAYVVGMPWQSGPVTDFQVFPDTVSPSQSRVEALRDAAPADGVTEAKVRVRLTDKHGNPVAKHFVELISSRSQDVVRPLNNGATDRFGEAFFYVTARKDGVSYFTAYDRNNGLAINQRAQAVFFQPGAGGGAMGGNLRLYMANGLFDDEDPSGDSDDGTFGDTAAFEIEMPSTVEVGKSIDITIKAVDAFGKTVKDHNGTIIFTTDDDNATIPDNYRFNERDLGEHTFEDGISFSRTGTFTLSVVDFIPDLNQENNKIKAELEVEVVDHCVGSECDPSPAPSTPAPLITPAQSSPTPFPDTPDPPDFTPDALVIKSPANNSAHGGTGSIALMGNGTPNTDIKIFVDAKEWQTLTVDPDGDFNGQLTNLADGQHTVYVQMADQADLKSAPVAFVIDSSPPILDATTGVQITPAGELEAGQAFTVKIVSESNLEAVKVNIGDTGTVVQLIERTDQPGTYQLTFDAPQAAGLHNLTLILEDKYNNRTEITNAAAITVKGKAALLTAPPIVEAVPGNSQIKLAWQAVAGTDIAGYNVYSGENSLVIDRLQAQVFAPKTEAMIMNLENGKEYFFQIAAVDLAGIEGPRSYAISAVPLDPDPTKTATPLPSAPPDEFKSIVGMPGDGMIEISWDAPVIPPAAFDIRFGISAGVYTERFSVSGTTYNAVIPDLINDLPYYITVVPLDPSGIPTGEQYIELRVAPDFSGVHKSAEHPPLSSLQGVKNTVGAGPESVFLFFVSLSFTGAAFFFHRAYRFARVA